MCLVFGYLFANLLTMVFGCTPIDKFWKSTIPGHCISSTYFLELSLSVPRAIASFRPPEIPALSTAD